MPQKAGRARQELLNNQRTLQPSRRELDPRCVAILDRIAISSFAEVIDVLHCCRVCPRLGTLHLAQGIYARLCKVQVFIGRCEGTSVVVKLLLGDVLAMVDCFRAEVTTLTSLRHPNLLQLIGKTLTCMMPPCKTIATVRSALSTHCVECFSMTADCHAAYLKDDTDFHRCLAVHRSTHASQPRACAGYTVRPVIAMVTEYMARGSVFAMLRQHGNKPLQPKLQWSMAVSVARGMAYLHDCNPPILHTVRLITTCGSHLTLRTLDNLLLVTWAGARNDVRVRST